MSSPRAIHPPIPKERKHVDANGVNHSWNCHQLSMDKLAFAEPWPGRARVDFPGQRTGEVGQTSGLQAGRHELWVLSMWFTRQLMPLGQGKELNFPHLSSEYGRSCFTKMATTIFSFPHALQEHFPSWWRKVAVYFTCPGTWQDL